MIKIVSLVSMMLGFICTGTCLVIVGKVYNETIQVIGAILLICSIPLFVTVCILENKGD